jgi:hypothetical protein
MVETPLSDIRRHVRSLASREGTYYLFCDRTGDRPVPAAELSFETRRAAEIAAVATEQYRAFLRQYDPRLPRYDVVVGQHGPSRRGKTVCDCADGSVDGGSLRWGLSEPVVTAATQRDLGEFCHDVAGAVFEVLAARGYRAVETAIVESYLALAGEHTDTDRLCLCLLERTATELAERLSPPAQQAVLSAAAARLGTGSTATDSKRHTVDAALAELQTVGLVGGYEHAGEAGQADTVRVTGYALTAREGRLPLLPVLVELYRRRHRWLPVSITPTAGGDGWHIEFACAGTADTTACSVAPEVA